MPANRDETGRFVKGKSGNPSGRPKVPEQFKELVQEKSIPALRAIIAISGLKRWYSVNAERLYGIDGLYIR